MWLIVLALFILLFLFIQTSKADPRVLPVNRATAKKVIAQWRGIAEPFCNQYGVPLEKALAHICVESRGEAYALRNDALKESFYGITADAAFLKLSEWEKKGYLATSVSMGPMQVVPKWGLADFNRFYGRSVAAAELISDMKRSVEVGIGFLLILRNRWQSWDVASRAYNGNIKSDVTLAYLQKIKAYELLIKSLLTS